MALKTFNLDEKIYKQFSKYCKEQGISMSKKIENFIKQELEKIEFKSTNRTNDKKTEINENEHFMKRYC